MCFECCDICLRLTTNRIRIDIAALLVKRWLIRWHSQPALDQRLVYLEVKLESVSMLAVTKCLHIRGRRTGELYGTVRQCDTVLMPLEHALPLGERRQHRVFSAGRRQIDVVPADFTLFIARHGAADGLRQQLCPEADSEHRHITIDRFTQKFDFCRKIRVIRNSIRVHRATEHDERRVFVERGSLFSIAAEVYVTNAKPRRLQERVERSKRFVRDMLKYKDLWSGHRFEILHCTRGRV